jgi:hypothetical protein
VVCELTCAQVPLSLVACKPAPKITVSFSGPTAQIAALRALLMEIWEQIITSHDASLEERLDIIPPNLPTMRRIGTETEAALAWRRTLEAGVQMFLEVGAYIPEMNDPERFTPARLLRISSTLQRRRAYTGMDDLRPLAEEEAIEMIVAEERAHLREALPTQPVWIGSIRVG